MHIEVRLFNSLQGGAASRWQELLELRAESTVGDVVRALGIPAREIHVVLRNGTVVGRSFDDAAALPLAAGDVLALSGPVPFSWGYGAPVV